MRKLQNADFVGLRSSMTLEEVDCERRGYKLTKTVLGTGAYAKVKLAYVLENKLEKDKRLAEDLVKKGHNMVGNLQAFCFVFCLFLLCFAFFMGEYIRIVMKSVKKTDAEKLM